MAITGWVEVGPVGEQGKAGGGSSAAASNWEVFAGGELEGRRGTSKCAACRSKRAGATESGQVLCFQCHQSELRRERALRAAADVDTGSVSRFQAQLPFEPVNRPRLDRLRSARATLRAAAATGPGRFEARRREAQIAARRLLQSIVPGVRRAGAVTPAEARAFASAVRAAELQLPDSWLPFVVGG